jgi:hypothetical protein
VITHEFKRSAKKGKEQKDIYRPQWQPICKDTSEHSIEYLLTTAEMRRHCAAFQTRAHLPFYIAELAFFA